MDLFKAVKETVTARQAAELYGLEILARGVNYNSNNTTRFVVVSPVMELREGADKISAVLSLPDEVGSLHEVLTIFAVHGLNLVKLESRPLPGRSWPSCSASSPPPRASRCRSSTAR